KELVISILISSTTVSTNKREETGLFKHHPLGSCESPLSLSIAIVMTSSSVSAPLGPRGVEALISELGIHNCEILFVLHLLHRLQGQVERLALTADPIAKGNCGFHALINAKPGNLCIPICLPYCIPKGDQMNLSFCLNKDNYRVSPRTFSYSNRKLSFDEIGAGIGDNSHDSQKRSA
ncbi:MAG TPA: hypothetical protein VF918_12280, partial [Anaerolineales bacterium]